MHTKQLRNIVPLRNCTMLYAFEIPNISDYNRHQTAYIFAYMIIMY